MPAIVLGAVSFAYVLRLTRTSVAENLTADYVRTGAAKGLPRRRVITAHVLRNSLIPVGHFLAADHGPRTDGAIANPRLFNITGVGGSRQQAIQRGEWRSVDRLTGRRVAWSA